MIFKPEEMVGVIDLRSLGALQDQTGNITAEPE